MDNEETIWYNLNLGIGGGVILNRRDTNLLWENMFSEFMDIYYYDKKENKNSFSAVKSRFIKDFKTSNETPIVRAFRTYLYAKGWHNFNKRGEIWENIDNQQNANNQQIANVVNITENIVEENIVEENNEEENIEEENTINNLLSGDGGESEEESEEESEDDDNIIDLEKVWQKRDLTPTEELPEMENKIICENGTRYIEGKDYELWERLKKVRENMLECLGSCDSELTSLVETPHLYDISIWCLSAERKQREHMDWVLE